jgi:hypothetical protein
MLRTVENVMRRYGCSADAARIYMDMRDEGHPRRAAELMAGIAPVVQAVKACDGMRNTLVRQALKQSARRFTQEPLTVFGDEQ